MVGAGVLELETVTFNELEKEVPEDCQPLITMKCGPGVIVKEVSIVFELFWYAKLSST
jgi:hypothetical protein